MNGQGLTSRYSYFDQFKPDEIEHYLDYLRGLERQGPAGLTQDRRFVSGPEELALQPEPEYGGLGYGAPEGIEQPRMGIPEAPERREPISEAIGAYTPVEEFPTEATPEQFESALAAFGTTFPRAMMRMLPELVASVMSAIRGGDIDVEKGWSDEFIEKNRQKAEAFAKKYGTKHRIAPGITVEDVARLPQNVGFTLTSAAVGLGVGVPVAAISRPAGWAAGTLASGVVAHRMAKDQFVGDLFQLFNDQAVENKGRELTEKEWESIKDKYEGKAFKYGLWEAIPEAVGQAASLGIIRMPIGKFLKLPAVKNRLLRTLVSGAAKFAGMQTEEQITETITQYGQAGVEAEVGLREKPIGVVEAFKEQYPQTALLTTFMAGLGGVGTRGYDVLTEPKAPPPSPEPYKVERKYTPPVDLISTMTEEDKNAVKGALAEAKKGTLTVDQLEGIQNILTEKYPRNTKEIQDIEKEIARLREVAPALEEEIAPEEVVPVPIKSAEESARIMEERLAEEEELRRSEAGQFLLREQLAEEAELAEEAQTNEDYMAYMDLTPDSDEIMEIEGIEVRKLSEIPVEVELPEGIEAKAYTDGENIYLKEGLSPEEFISAVDEEMESIRTGVVPSIEEEYPELVEAAEEIEPISIEEEIEVAPTVEPTIEEIDRAAKEAETEPTEAQKEAGTYKKGHIKLYGYDISIENPKGSMRTGVDRTGREWAIELKHHYGYIRGTKGKDKDHLDVFIGSKPESDKVFVVDQIVPDTGKFDEHKIMMGFPTIQQARVGYLANYERGWKGLGNITELTVDEFKEWTKGDTTKPIGEVTKPEVKPTASFIAWQETPEGDHIALYNIESGPKEGTQMMVEGLKREGIAVPETPKKPPAKKPMLYEPRGLEEAKTIRKEMGSLETYNLQSQTEWLGDKKPPADGKLTVYRATPTGEEIKPGDYVTNNREYAELHIEANLGGKGKITSIKTTLDDIYPADAPKEFWYAPKSIEKPKKVVPVKEKVEEVAKPIPEIKEPYKMGKQEYVDYYKKQEPFKDMYNAQNILEVNHEKFTKKAITEGKITSHPDYPELGKMEKVEVKIPPRPLVNPKASYIQQDKQKLKQQAWDKKYGEIEEKPTPPEPEVEKKPAFIAKETQIKAREAETKAREKRLRFAASQKHLVPWISASGGVLDPGLAGEINDIIYTQDARGRKKPRKGVMQGFLSKKTGRTLDVVVRDAREAGFDVKDTDHLLDLIEKDLNAASTGDIKGRVGKLTTEPTTEEEFIEGLIENGREDLRRKGLSDQEIERTLEEGSEDAETIPVDTREEEFAKLEREAIEEEERLAPEELEVAKKKPTEEVPPTKTEKLQAKITALEKEAFDVAKKIAKPWSDKFKARYELEIKRHEKQITSYKQQIADLVFVPPPTGILFPPEPETRLAMAGERAIGAPTGALAKAQEMLAKGEDEEAVRKETGWMRGVEGKWKWEIDDSGAKITYRIKELGIDSFSYIDGIQLQDFLNHPALFKAYPQLKTIDMKMELGELNLLSKGLKVGASYSQQRIEIRAKNLRQAKDELFHEIQHAIQVIEGFARGGMPTDFYPIKGVPLGEEASGIIQDISALIKSKDRLKVAIKEAQKTGDLELIKKFGFSKQLKEIEDRISALTPKGRTELYKRLAGEVEAREVAMRKPLTPELRRLLPPYFGETIPREDWIIKKGEGTSFSVEPALAAEPRSYEFTKQQQKDLIKIGQLIPQWLKRAGADAEVLKNVTVELKPFIDLRGKKVDKTLKDWETEGIDAGTILGATTFGHYHALMQLAINGQNLSKLETSTYHEWYHIAKAWMLPQSDIAALRKHFKTEESEADAFAAYMKDAKSIRGQPSLIRRLFMKLKRMLNIIRNGLNAKGFTRPEDVFGSIRVGAYKPIRAGLTPELKLALEKRFFYAVAIKVKDGTLYKGTPGEIHLDVMDRIPTEKIGRMHQNLLYDDMGFIDPEGKFYTRSEATKAVGEWEARRMGAVGLMPETRLAMKKLTPEEREWADNWIKENVRPPEKQVAQVPKQKEEFKELPKEEDKPVEPSFFEEAKDDWFGNKDWSRQVFTVEAKRIQDTIMEVLDKKRYDKECQDIDHAIHVYLDLKRNPEHLEEFYDDLTADQKKIVNLATKIEENPGLMHIADYLRTVYDKIGQQALSQNVIFNTIDNYVARAWKIPKKIPTDIMQKFKTTSRHAKHRVFETILEGWSKGYELEITGASNNLELLRNEIGRTIEDKRLVSKLRKLEWKDTGNPLIIHKQLKGYEEIKHPNFTYWVPEARIKRGELKVYGPKFRVQTNWGAIKGDNKRATKLFDNQDAARVWVTVQKDAAEFRIEKRDYLWRREPLYAPEEIAKRLNKILGVSKLKGIGPIDTITKYNAIFKSTILLTSLFHHQAFIRSYLLGTRHKTLAEWNPFKMYKEGLKAINELGPEIELLVRNGLTLGKMQDWEENILRQEDTVIGKVLDKTPYTKAFKEWANELRERQAKFLFQNFGAGLKAQAALIEYRNMLKENPDLEPNERAKIIADLINDDFGGLHLQRMERNPTTQHIFRLMALAPDWTESNVNTMWKAFRSGEVAKTHLYRRFWASVITKGLTAQVIANILLSFMDEDDFIDRFKKAWKAGHFRWLDIDVTPIYKLFGGKSEARKYFGIFGHFRDPMKFIIHPIRSAKHKGSVFFRIFLEALTGTDWKGHRFTSLSEVLGYDDKGLYVRETEEHKIGEPKGGKLRLKTVTPGLGKKGPIGWQQIPSYMISQLRNIMPVQVQNFIGWLQGDIQAFDAIGRSIGAHVGSTYPTEKKQTEDFVNQWLEIKRGGESFAELRAKVRDYNERQKLRPTEDAIPISWSTIAKKGINIRKAELTAERRKAVNE